MNARYPLQSFTVTPTGISADKFTFTQGTRTIVLHGSDNFESLVGQTISLTLTLTNQGGDIRMYQQEISVLEPELKNPYLEPVPQSVYSFSAYDDIYIDFGVPVDP